MSKELVISATQHETRVAILEEGQLCEIYVEREKEFALVGSIYKGRVTRVLPGMQSAFVDIGLDSDAFLYVSDFLENLEDYDHIVHSVEEKVQKMEEQGGSVFTPAAPAVPAVPAADATVAADAPPVAAEPAAAPEPAANGQAAEAPAPGNAFSEPRRDFDRNRGPRHEGRGFGDRGGFGRGRGGRRGRRGRRGGRDDRPDRGGFRRGRELPPSKFASPHAPSYESGEPSEPYEPIILPGESLAKYRDRAPGAASPAPPASSFDAAALREPEAREPEAAAIEPAVAQPEPAPAEEPRSVTPAIESLPVQEPEPESNPVTSHFAESPAAAPAKVEEPAPLAAIPTIPPPVFDPAPAREPQPEPAAAEHSLSAEEMTEIAEQVAEAEAEMAAESHEADDESGDEDANGMEYGEEAPEEDNAEEPAFEAAGDSAEEGPGGPEDEPQPGNTWSAADEAQDAAESRPAQARVEDRHRARFQRPMRRGGRGRRGMRRGGRPDRRPPRQQRALPLIADLLKANQEIIVQIAKEPLGKKGARITSHVALPGRYLVYMPTVEHIGVSRKIASAERRSRLRHIVGEAKSGHGFPGGFIVRTAADSASEEEIRSDVEYLGRTWMDILQRGEGRRAPSLLHRDLNLVERILRDHLSSDYTSIWIDNEEEYTRVVEFVSRFQPSLVNRVKLFVKPTPIFEEFGIQQEIDKALRPKVWLKSGGYIVINHTEALVAIDVNTGKFVGKGSSRLEDTIVRTNLDAVKEIVRQIRLRDLGGIIVIDFIDMEERKNRMKVMQALEDALRSDKAPSKVLSFNEFGLVAITRKRTKQALERVLCQPCTYCSGSGMVKSIPTLCYEIQTEARKMAGELDSASLTLRVHPEIAKALKTRESTLVEELEQWTRKSVIIQADPTLHWEQYDIY